MLSIGVKRLIGVKMIGSNTARPFLPRTMARRQLLQFALRYVDLTLGRSTSFTAISRIFADGPILGGSARS